ncbi:alpha-1,6-glucosidase domain-containing protein [Roseateles sp. BYS180W]|uniref:Alpha-1,6-glucosidase domain-containing protein n=1 Tax=Roseateles rivi TaxID=3299028 RepID=A0ABW7FS28_9BURK
MFRTLCAGLLGLLALLPARDAGAAGLSAQALRQACDAPGFDQVLQAQRLPAHGAAAQALSVRELVWAGLGTAPGETLQGLRFVLYHSPTGQLQLDTHGRVQGHAQTLPLQDGGPFAAQGHQAWIGAGRRLRLSAGVPLAHLQALLRGQLLLVAQDSAARVRHYTGVQPGAWLDALYASAEAAPPLGVNPEPHGGFSFRLWAPTARAVYLCHHASAEGPLQTLLPLQRQTRSGLWQGQGAAAWRGGYYRYLVEVQVPGTGRVLNRVTDPYSVSLNADSRRSYIADLADPALKPPGWDALRPPARVQRNTEMVVYELHVRDFSRDDPSVPAARRGRYEAFAEPDSLGMQHLSRLSQAGLTDVHLLPVFDYSSVPERGCTAGPVEPPATPDSLAPQAQVMAQAGRDCFNWGYDPLHFNAPEGSYASDANEGGRRILEFRRMVQGLAGMGLRTGMDLVFNHMAASGQQAASVLDRIVPGYYHRYDAQGRIERSTCCDNTATERRMMGRLLLDSVLQWARHYRIASFRFDLMAHQPRALMQRLQTRLQAELGYFVPLIGEGWNFGEVADGARFVQASQLSLYGSGIATFSDRARDALRGGSAADSGADMVRRQGWLNGQFYAPNALGSAAQREDLLRSADWLRVGLAGSLRDYRLHTWDGQERRLADIDYAGQSAGYTAAPGEVVNYADNHDNQTLFDINALRLPQDTTREDRARVQVLGMALTAFSQGVAYFHAGIETLRSKSLDRNSYDSGDWFNRLDWTLQNNHFGSGLPPQPDNAAHYPWMAPVLANPRIKPQSEHMRWSAAAFADLLRLRTSTRLFALDSAAEVRQRLRFHNTGPQQQATLLVGELDGQRLPGANFSRVIYAVNADVHAHTLHLPHTAGQAWHLHPLHLQPGAADPRPREQAHFNPTTGHFVFPPRTALVFVVD